MFTQNFRSITPNMPCTQDCPDRCATCHTCCERYIVWEKAHLKDVKERRKMSADAFFHRDFQLQGVYKAQKEINRLKKLSPRKVR